MPADSGRLEAIGTKLGEQGQVVEGLEERDCAHLTQSDLSAEEVLALDRAPELSSGSTLDCHRTDVRIEMARIP
jgi:hypothetical protein